MAGKTKLELTWIGKDERPRLEPRILIEEPAFSHHAEARREGDHFDNMLIHGDNLLALKALETDPNVRGKVKCIFIDPPYNTGNDFLLYPDGVEHSMWLSMMRDRLEILYNLLSDDGSIWVALDDNEAHYFKVLADEVFGRGNFIGTVVWRKNYAPKSSAQHISVDQDYIFIYAKKSSALKLNSLPRTEQQNSIYNNPDNDPRGPWTSDNLSARNPYSLGQYEITTPTGRIIPGPPAGRYWAISLEKLKELDADNRIYWTSNGNGTPRLKRFLSEVRQGRIAQTYWPYEEVGHTQDAKKESVKLFGSDAFPTPKPEKLIQRVLTLATSPGDLVLDSFAGSGTTGAVAHKMGRRWIMVELHNHAKTHIVPRMQKVIDGTDKGGVTETVSWKGGGGYRFFKLAPSLLQKDKWGNLVINKDYQPEMLAEAMCKHFNFTYAPSSDHYWMHGQASESSYIYVTTNSLSFEHLKALSDEVGESRSLLVCCMAYEAAGDDLPNLTIKKIPRVVLDRCEWGKDDYSLKIAALPIREEEPEEALPAPKPNKTKTPKAQASLFDTPEEE